MSSPAKPAVYRGREKMTLEEFIADVEKCHFRTQYDTGANPNAMFIWNIVRNWAGMDLLERDDLIRNYAERDGSFFEEMKERDRRYIEERRLRGD